MLDLITGEIGLNSAPVVARDVVIVGAAHRAGGAPRSKTNAKGYVRGFDVRTGKRLWIFHTIPQLARVRQRHLGEGFVVATPAMPACGRRSRSTRSSASPTCRSSCPPATTTAGIARAMVCSARALVAVDLQHGAAQVALPADPPRRSGTTTSRARRSSPTSPSTGEQIKAVAQPSKQGFLYVFDRQTGQPVWPIEERPVPQSKVPGEKTSATQPFPTKPPPFERAGFLLDYLLDFTPELKAEA